jgi:hypothetical protein
MNSTDMYFKASLLCKCFAANLTLVWLRFSMNHYDVGLEIFSYNTEITLFICFFLVIKHLSLLTKLFKTQLNKSLPVEKMLLLFLIKLLCLLVGLSKNKSKNRRRAYYGADGGRGMVQNKKIKH